MVFESSSKEGSQTWIPSSKSPAQIAFQGDTNTIQLLVNHGAMCPAHRSLSVENGGGKVDLLCPPPHGCSSVGRLSNRVPRLLLTRFLHLGSGPKMAHAVDSLKVPVTSAEKAVPPHWERMNSQWCSTTLLWPGFPLKNLFSFQGHRSLDGLSCQVVVLPPQESRFARGRGLLTNPSRKVSPISIPSRT